MSTLPPNIDAILASIRSRMADDEAPPAPEVIEPQPPMPAPVPAPAPPVADLGQTIITGEARTLEQVVHAMLEPMLKGWLDANMPEIVEKMAQAEIRRLTGRG